MSKSMRSIAAVLLAGVMIGGQGGTADACSSLVVGKDASTTGHAFFGRSADYSTLSTANLQVFPQGSFRRGQCLTDPYERQTYGKDVNYSYLFSHDSYKFLAAPFSAFSSRLVPSDARVYHTAGINEKGVAVSATNTTYLRREAEVKDNAYTEKGIGESFATMILLAEADSARDGVRRMGEIVERDGVGNKEGFLLMIGDSQEVWVFETLGHRRWVASRVPDDKFLVVANDTVTDYVDLNDPEHYLGSADSKEFAIKQGFAVYGPQGSGHEKDVNLAASYGGEINHPLFDTYRRWRGYQLFAPSQKIAVKKGQSDIYPMFVKPDHKISPLDEMNFHRDRYEGTAYDCSTAKQAPLYPDGYEDEISYDEGKKLVRPMGVEYAVSVHILETNDYPAEIGGRVWYCLGAPEDSVFLPYYGNVTDTHPWCKTYVDGNYRIDNEGIRRKYPRYQPDSAAEVFMNLGARARADRVLYGNVIKAYWQGCEQRLMAEQPAVEQQILSLYREDPAKSAQFATNYSMQVEQYAVNRAALMRKELLHHIATAPKTTFVVPAEEQPYVNLEPRTDPREDVNEPLVVEHALGLGVGTAREDTAPVVDYTQPAPVLKSPDAQALPDSAASLQMKFGPKADFSRLQYTIELMGKDYAAFGNDPERVRQELRLFIGDKELIGAEGLVPLQEAVQKNAVQVLGDAQRATVTVNFYAIDDDGSPLWQSGMLIVPDGQKDQNIRFTVYAASTKGK